MKSDHTKTHPSLPTLTSQNALSEIEGSRQDLLNAGISTVNTFVYPYGDYNDQIIDMVRNAGYIGARSVLRGANDQDANPFLLKIQQVDRNTTLEEVRLD